MPTDPGGGWFHGTTLTFGGVNVDGLRTVPVEGGARAQVDITSHRSEGRERTVPGLKSATQPSFECLYIPGDPGQEAMIDNHGMEGADIQEVIVTAPPSILDTGYPQQSFTFDAYVLDWEISLPHDNNPGVVTFTLSRESDTVVAVVAEPES